MRLATLNLDGKETGALRLGGGYIPLSAMNAGLGTDWPEELQTLIETGRLNELRSWYAAGGRAEVHDRLLAEKVAPDQARFGPLYRCPGKIWGIGLNYAAHAADLSETAPTFAPASFMKPGTAVIGPADAIRIPRQSQRTTAEAELGVVIGRPCRNVDPKDWRDVVAGFTTVIDMTAEDILRKNPRYLTLAKSFDTFFSFGPELVTEEEIGDVSALTVATIHNGRVHAQNTVANMTFPPDRLVAFHSEVMTLLPGDIISTGTPGAAVVGDGDTVECRIDGFAPLVNPVVGLKMGLR
ncbi:MAG: fumarylacetoacetate hydrolase family protein [Desulfobacterales bacterium]|jgi:2-keto-4-pentenoate hydratase/2-oxohepta-3-ene-1,7-dioic acid hydratase in catechol pathway